jgi:hypothetical protein
MRFVMWIDRIENVVNGVVLNKTEIINDLEYGFHLSERLNYTYHIKIKMSFICYIGNHFLECMLGNALQSQYPLVNSYPRSTTQFNSILSITPLASEPL